MWGAGHAQVLYKATELLDDQILMTGFAAGGLSQVPESFFRTASLSAPLAQEQGIFGIKPEVLPVARLMLASKPLTACFQSCLTTVCLRDGRVEASRLAGCARYYKAAARHRKLPVCDAHAALP